MTLLLAVRARPRRAARAAQWCGRTPACARRTTMVLDVSPRAWMLSLPHIMNFRIKP
jgi:hypothetical protein